jgi:hypothetical protein
MSVVGLHTRYRKVPFSSGMFHKMKCSEIIRAAKIMKNKVTQLTISLSFCLLRMSYWAIFCYHHGATYLSFYQLALTRDVLKI